MLLVAVFEPWCFPLSYEFLLFLERFLARTFHLWAWVSDVAPLAEFALTEFALALLEHSKLVLIGCCCLLVHELTHTAPKK